MRHDIEDSLHRLIGWWEEGELCNIGYVCGKGYIGMFDKECNQTLTVDGRIYCYGDGLVALIRSLAQ